MLARAIGVPHLTKKEMKAAALALGHDGKAVFNSPIAFVLRDPKATTKLSSSTG